MSTAVATRLHPVAELFPVMGDAEFDALKADIALRGVLEPVWIYEGQVLDGRHRTRACDELGIVCPQREYDGSDPVGLVVSLNLKRRHLSESQRAMVATKLADIQNGGDRRSDQSAILRTETLTQPQAAALLNVSERLVQDARVIANTSPELAAQVERGEKTVTQAAREIRHADRLARLPDAPSSTYRVFYADPPWLYNNSGVINSSDGYGRAERHYPTLSIAEMCALPVKDWADDVAVLFLWVTSPFLLACAPVIDAWGFTYKTSFVWDKVKHNYGHYNSVRHEFLLVCTRGSCTPDIPTLFDSVVTVERSETHSEKPEQFRKLIETLYPNGRRLELFARDKADGWDVYGNE